MRPTLALVVLGLALVPAPARGDDTLDQARTYFNIGARAYEAGQFMDAVHAFEQAHKLTPRDGLLFSIAQAYRKQYYVDQKPEHLRAAIRYYRDYLAHVPKGGRRADAAEGLAELEPRAAALGSEQESPPPAPETRVVTQVMVSSPTQGASIELDGRSAGKLPFVSDVKPGPHHIVLTAPGYAAYARDITVLPGSVVPLDVALREQPAHLVIDAPSGARIGIDGKEIGFAPLAPVQLAPGHHFVAVTKNGRQAWSRDVDLGRGTTTRLSAQLERTGQRTTSWIFLGAGATGWVASGVLALGAVKKQNDARAVLDRRATGNISSGDVDTYDSLRSQRDTYRTASIACAAGGTALFATGLFLFVFDEPRLERPEPAGAPRGSAPDRQEAPAMEVSAAPLWAPGLAGGAVQGRF